MSNPLKSSMFAAFNDIYSAADANTEGSAAGWRHEAGYWDRQQAKAWGDRDHDGVPNAVDRHPDNPYRR